MKIQTLRKEIAHLQVVLGAKNSAIAEHNMEVATLRTQVAKLEEQKMSLEKRLKEATEMQTKAAAP